MQSPTPTKRSGSIAATVRAAVVREAKRIAARGGDPSSSRSVERLVRLAERVREREERDGCVQLRRCRATGTVVGVYRSVAAGIETDPELPWSTVCEEHHTVVCSATRQLAEVAACYPDFCEECQPKLAEA